MPVAARAGPQSPVTSGLLSSMPWSATRKNAVRSHTPARSTAARIWPSRASLSWMLARAISAYGPLWWKAASVSVKLTKQYRGSWPPPSHTSRAWVMPVWSMRDETS